MGTLLDWGLSPILLGKAKTSFKEEKCEAQTGCRVKLELGMHDQLAANANAEKHVRGDRIDMEERQREH